MTGKSWFCGIFIFTGRKSFSQDENREALTTTRRFWFLERSQSGIFESVAFTLLQRTKTLALVNYSQQMLVFPFVIAVLLFCDTIFIFCAFFPFYFVEA